LRRGDGGGRGDGSDGWAPACAGVRVRERDWASKSDLSSNLYLTISLEKIKKVRKMKIRK